MSDTVHALKCWPEPFAAVRDGRKRFEFRKDDRGFAVGDVLELKEWEPCEHCNATGRVIDVDDGESIACSCAMTEHPSGAYSGRFHRARVTYILRDGFGVPDGYCTMSIEGIVGDMSDPTQRDVEMAGALLPFGTTRECWMEVASAIAKAREEGWRQGMGDAAALHDTHAAATTHNGIEIVPVTMRHCETMKAWAAFFRARIEREKGGGDVPPFTPQGKALAKVTKRAEFPQTGDCNE